MRPLRRPTPAQFVVTLICGLILIRLLDGHAASDLRTHERRSVFVAHVIDGDTFVTGQGERVRLLGIDAPEVERRDVSGEFFSRESAQWLKQRIEGTNVWLVHGKTSLDHYDRTLAWVYVSGRQLINRELLATGHAKLLDRYGLPLHLEHSLREAEATARTEHRGIWNR